MIFPQLKEKKFGYVNLNLEAISWCEKNNIKPTKENNPLLSPETCQKFVEDTHKKYSLDFSYGGWMEDRSYIWQSGYLEKSQMFIHLGVDINIPNGTEIATNFEAEIVKIDDDFPLDGGWGPHVILRDVKSKIYLLYAHLEKDIPFKEGDIIAEGTVFAKVGKAPQNGNWFPHVHIQAISEEKFKNLLGTKDWEAFDGYGSKETPMENSKNFPDPLNFIKINYL